MPQMTCMVSAQICVICGQIKNPSIEGFVCNPCWRRASRLPVLIIGTEPQSSSPISKGEFPFRPALLVSPWLAANSAPGRHRRLAPTALKMSPLSGLGNTLRVLLFHNLGTLEFTTPARLINHTQSTVAGCGAIHCSRCFLNLATRIGV